MLLHACAAEAFPGLAILANVRYIRDAELESSVSSDLALVSHILQFDATKKVHKQNNIYSAHFKSILLLLPLSFMKASHGCREKVVSD